MAFNSNRIEIIIFLAFLLTSHVTIYGVDTTGEVEVDVQEKVLTWAYNAPFGDENTPTHSLSVYGADYMESIYNGLMKRTIASDRAFVNDLAATMPVISANNTQWTFKLRENLKFSDGSDLNASSIVFSYKVSLTSSIDSSASSLAQYFSNESITEIDNLTVKFNMSQPYAFAPSLFSRWIYSENHFGAQYEACLTDVTLAACDWNDVSGVNLKGGSAAFMMDKYNATDNFIELVPNPNYYNAAQIKLDRIVIKTNGDAYGAKEAFIAGETNVFDSQYKANSAYFANFVGVTDVFVGAPGVQEMVPNHNHQYFGLGKYSTTIRNARNEITGVEYSENRNLTVARNIRKAMSHIIDRVFIADEFTNGLGSPAATIMPKIAIGWDDTILPRTYSIATAQSYMEAAGFDFTGKTYDASTGAMNNPFFEITVLSPTGGADRDNWAALMVQELPKIGIGVKKHETGGFSTVLYPRTFTYPGPPPDFDHGGYDVFFVGWSFGLDWDPVGLYEFEFQNPECCNVYNYNNATVENAIADYINELDASARLPLVKTVQALLYDAQPSLPIVHTVDHWAWASNILGLDGLSMSQRDFEWELVDIDFDIENHIGCRSGYEFTNKGCVPISSEIESTYPTSESITSSEKSTTQSTKTQPTKIVDLSMFGILSVIEAFFIIMIILKTKSRYKLKN